MILQYSFSTATAAVYTPGAASRAYSSTLLDAVVPLLSALVPSNQRASMFEIDQAEDVPTAWSDHQETDLSGNTVTTQIPVGWRKHVTGVIATDLGTMPFDSETCSSELQTALLALWEDIKT